MVRITLVSRKSCAYLTAHARVDPAPPPLSSAETLPHSPPRRSGGAAFRGDRGRVSPPLGAVALVLRGKPRARVRNEGDQGRGHRGQLARRFGRPVASDLSTHPVARRGEKGARL